ncbi:alcohol dehydrogenase [Enhydrobacter aerosaccus]|uniref:Alcohol dehydrogenase n=1 Tax=Enhydrobacter aerosaccus TaxID=225324 RepID=A0A1T4PET4_9HYPH|nr:alcohol dehydrogenase catalytic domain-containing protein [Enhydrobacter aerosaccus]SJZ89318.1 alcohol dehydrogenase [Enhydrobacter aerosaccus]
MRHAVFVKPGLVEWREAPDPCLQGDLEALVRPVVVGRCDLDVAFVRGRMPMLAGAPIGHEIIGEILSVGDKVKRLRPGQSVFVPAQISCGVCGNCRRGFTGRCSAVPFAASYGMGREGGYGGGLADIVRVPFADAMLTPVPAHADPSSLIGLADMAADAWRAVAPRLARHPEARVAVLGGDAQIIGIYSAGLAVALGAATVRYIDRDPRRTAIAASYGAEVATDFESEAGAYDVVVVANATASALMKAFDLAAPGGDVVSVTPSMLEQPTFDTRVLYHRGVHWTIGRPDCRHSHDGVLSAWANCGFRADRVPTLEVSWEEAPAAWSSRELYVAAVRSFGTTPGRKLGQIGAERPLD